MAADTARRSGRFELLPLGPYSLGASARFLEGFAPAHYAGDGSDRLRLALIADGLDRGEKAAGAFVYPEGDRVVVETYGEAAPETVRDQAERILSLDVDGSGFPEVGGRDPVVGGLQRRYPGLRPILFYSPYEAAAWAIIGTGGVIFLAVATNLPGIAITVGASLLGNLVGLAGGNVPGGVLAVVWGEGLA